MSTILVPFNDLRPVMEDQKGKIQDAMNRVLASGSFILGNEGRALEEEVAKYVWIDYGIGVANGTDAITLALLYIRHHKSIYADGALVATVANSAPATAVAIRRAGCCPVYVDVLPNGLMDPDDLRRKLHKKIIAVVPVHLYGQIANLEAIDEACDRYDTPIVEDAAQAMGSDLSFRSKREILKCVSFYPTKNLGALGDGGMILTNSPYADLVLRHLRNYGLDRDGNIVIRRGFNSRLDELQAAILRERLKDLDLYNFQRQQIAKKYFQMLHPQVLHREFNSLENYHLFTIRHPNRPWLQDQLLKAGIETKIHYKHPAHKYFIEDMYITLPETQRHCSEVLSLPLWPGMDTTDIVRVCSAVNSNVTT